MGSSSSKLPSGYTWRPLNSSDVDAIVGLNHRWEEHHQMPFRSDRDEVESDLADPHAHSEDRSIGGWDPTETLRAVGWVYHRSTKDAPKHRALVWALAEPGWEELESSLMAWCDSVAEPILAGLDDERDKVLRAWSPAQLTDRIRRYEDNGYRVARYFATLSRPVDGSAAASPPDEISLVDWDQEADGHAIWEAHVEAFSDHWGSVPADWEMFQSDMVGDPHSRLDLSVVARAGDEVVGYSLNQVWPEDAAVRGLTEGYLGVIGVRRAWRRKGVATALILASIERFATAGFDNATLTADADSITGAFDLYKRLGFREVDTSVTLLKYPSGTHATE